MWIDAEIEPPKTSGRYKVKGMVGSMSEKPFEGDRFYQHYEHYPAGQWHLGDWAYVTHWWKWTTEEIEQAAKGLCDRHFPTWETECSACGATNCRSNKNCIKCGCQM